MTNTKNLYCRLCGELKPHNEVSNLQADEETYQKVVNKLSRFNIVMNFQQNILPNTVCSLCVNNLERAFAFVTAVEQAQVFLSNFILVQEKSDAYGEFTLFEPSEIGKDIKVESSRDPMDEDDDEANNLGEECDVHDDVGIDGDTEEVLIETENLKTSCVFVSEKINVKDETDECINKNELKDKPLDFNNDCLEKYPNVITNDFETNSSNFKLNENIMKNIEHNSKPILQCYNTVYSKDDINKLNHSNVGAGVPRKRQKPSVEPIPPEPLDTTVYSEEYITKQINRLCNVPVQFLKETWMDYEWKCSHCGTLFAHVEELQKHSIMYHNACNAYQCTECKIKKQRLNAFIKHVRHHRKYLHYSCYKCFEKFPKMMATSHHKTKIHENSKYVCLGCNAPFSSNSELEEHTNKYYNILFKKKTFISRDNLTCNTCDKVCATVTALRNHLNTHKEKKKDRICDRCGKCFDSNHSLRTHMDSHTKKVLYHCEICKTAFKSVYSLRYHASVHSGIKPFTCDVCRKCFRNKSQITNHMKFHSDYFPFSCSVCNKKCRTEGNLQKHMLQHTGEKPYSCDICQRDFTDMANRNKHMRRRHGIEMAKRRQPIIKQQTVDDSTASVTVEDKSADLDKMDEWKNKVMEHQKSQRANSKIKNRLISEDCNED